MTKRRAIILFVAMAALPAAYTTWCCRDFILRPRLAFGEVPDELRRGVTAAYNEADPFPPSQLTMDAFVRAISKPFEGSRCKAFVIPFQEHYVGIETSRSEWCYVTKVDGHWNLAKEPPGYKARQGEQ